MVGDRIRKFYQRVVADLKEIDRIGSRNAPESHLEEAETPKPIPANRTIRLGYNQDLLENNSEIIPKQDKVPQKVVRRAIAVVLTKLKGFDKSKYRSYM